MKAIHTIATLLIIVGALNWGLVGAFNFNLVEAIFGAGSALSRVVYVVVGLSGLVAAAMLVALNQGGATRGAPRHA